MTEDRIRELEARSTEFIQSEHCRGKTAKKKMSRASWTCGAETKDPPFI